MDFATVFRNFHIMKQFYSGRQQQHKRLCCNCRFLKYNNTKGGFAYAKEWFYCMVISFSELRAREVIRICDAETLGCVTDLIFDTCSGRICSLCVSPPCSVKGMLQGSVIVVPWDAVQCIGAECILVNMKQEECCPTPRRMKKPRCWEDHDSWNVKKMWILKRHLLYW